MEEAGAILALEESESWASILMLPFSAFSFQLDRSRDVEQINVFFL